MKPLEGIRVLDLTWVYAGPFGTLLLSDMGAEVIKLEGPPIGDMTRMVPPLKNGWSGYFCMLNRGKKSLALDLKSEEGKGVFFDLIRNMDVVTDNFTPGTLDRLGVGYEAARSINPNIIYASISGFGTFGPYSKKRCVDPVAQAMGGLMSLTGYPGMPPLKTGPATADALAGMNMVIGILAALHHRSKTGVGQRIEIAMMDSVFAVLEESIIRTSITGDSLTARGNTDPLGAPWDTFLTSDGKWVMVCAIGDDKFRLVYNSIGRSDIVEQYQGEDEEAIERRSKDLGYLNSIFAEWSKDKDSAELIKFFEDLRIPCGEVKYVPELIEDPHLHARNMIVDIEHPQLGPVKTFNIPIKLSATDAGVEKGENQLDPVIGEHSGAVLKDLLGYSDQKVKELQKANAIWA